MSMFQVTLVALAISLFANVWLFDSRDNAIKLAATERQTAQTNLESAKLCSAGVEQQQQDERDRDAKREQDRADTRPAIDAKKSEAMQILSTAPSTPGDECKSTADLLTNWHRGRTRK